MSHPGDASGRALLLCVCILAADARAVSARGTGADGALIEDPRLYLGMWTAHVRGLSSGLDSNRLIGLSYGGFYGGTFINSFGGRSITVGIERTFGSRRSGSTAPSLGYRLGLVTGYDERFIGIAGHVPVLPLAQIVGRLHRGRFGAEVACSGLALSFALSGRF